MSVLIDIIADVAKLILWLALIAAALIYMFNPRQGRALLIRIFWAAVGLSVAFVALNSVAVSLAGIGAQWILLLLALGASFIAYLVRAARRGEHKLELRGAERTPLVPQHLNGEDEQQ